MKTFWLHVLRGGAEVDNGKYENERKWTRISMVGEGWADCRGGGVGGSRKEW